MVIFAVLVFGLLLLVAGAQVMIQGATAGFAQVRADPSTCGPLHPAISVTGKRARQEQHTLV